VAKEQPASGTDKWQKRYYRGVDMDEKQAVADHQIKPRLAEFGPGHAAAGGAPRPHPPKRQPVELAPFAAEAAAAPPQAAPPSAAPDAAAIQRTLQAIGTELMFGADPAPLVQRLIGLGAPETEARRIIETAVNDPLIVNGRAAALALRKRDWLLDTIEKHWQLRPGSERIERRASLSSEEFLERYYAPGRPVILVGEMAEWPALAKWTPQYLRETIGDRPIEFQGERTKSERFEMYKDAHRREMPFDRFIDLIVQPGAGNDAYMTAYNSAKNAEAIVASSTSSSTARWRSRTA
jgi:Fe2+ transport system protein FeoA